MKKILTVGALLFIAVVSLSYSGAFNLIYKNQNTAAVNGEVLGVATVNLQQGTNGYSGASSLTMYSRFNNIDRDTHYYRYDDFTRYYNLEHFDLSSISNFGTVSEAKLILYKVGGGVFTPKDQKVYIRRINDPDNLGSAYSTGWKITSTVSGNRFGANVESRDDSTTPDTKWQNSDPSSPEDLNTDYFKDVLKPIEESPYFVPKDADPVGTAYEIDVTSDVECFRTGQCKNQGWTTYHEGAANIQNFIANSRNANISLRPLLKITYTEDPSYVPPSNNTGGSNGGGSSTPDPETPPPPVSTGPATWYIRTDGGNATQCTGKTDAAYPGSGTNQNCAVNHINWLLSSPTQWRISGGDTIIIKNGSYMLGLGSPGTTEPGSPFYSLRTLSRSIVLPQIPSGISSSQKTRILGEGYATGCSSKPELWGTGGIFYMFYLGTSDKLTGWDNPNITASSHVEFNCLEITDHATCMYGANPPLNYRCEDIFIPYNNGAWAKNAFEGNFVSDIHIENVDAHGLAGVGLYFGNFKDLVVKKSRFSGFYSAMNIDICGQNLDPKFPNCKYNYIYGTNVFEDSEISFSGCTEKYPYVEDVRGRCGEIIANFSDGLGLVEVLGTFIFRRNLVAYNGQDGIDLLYAHDPNTVVIVENNLFHSNGGNQIKIGGANTTVANNLIVGSCGWLTNTYGVNAHNPLCRAGGHPMVFSSSAGSIIRIYNNTITAGDIGQNGNRPSPILGVCKNTSEADVFILPCDSATKTYINNNLLVGTGTGSDGVTLPAPYGIDLFFVNSPNTEFKNNLIYNLRTPCPYSKTFGVGTICSPTLPIVNPTLGPEFDGHLVSGALAINAGINTGVGVDYAYGSRPQASAYDIGAYEFGATPGVPTSPSIPNTPTTPTDTTAPTISSITTPVIASSSVTIAWATNESSDTQVEYGLTTSYGSSSVLKDTSVKVTSHSVVLSGLTPNTLYNFRVKSRDAAGNITNSTNQTFVTLTTGSQVVSGKFKNGDKVKVTSNVNVRLSSSISGSLLGSQTTGSTGTVSSGPVNSDGFSWWNVNYDSGVDGWSVEDFLQTYTPPTSTPSNDQTTTTGGANGGTTQTTSNTSTTGNSTSDTSATSDARTTTTATTVTTQTTSGIQIKTPINSNLSSGSKSPEVTTVQRFLIKESLLTSDSATGFYGPLTEAAIKAFQRKYGIVSSGSPGTTGYGAVGPKTRMKINELLGIKTTTTTTVPTTTGSSSLKGTKLTKPLSRGAKGTDVVTLQNVLIKEGLLAPGNNTGLFGPLTEAALKAFQKKYNIVISGTASTTGFGSTGPKTRAKVNEIGGL